MVARFQKGGLQVANVLVDLVDNRITPGIGINPDIFWEGFEVALEKLAPKNQFLLQKRKTLQTQIDDWHHSNKGQKHNIEAYKQMLFDIGYIIPEGDDFKITTANVDPEIAITAGAQLVVPTSNARFALNAANARWGSLYDALYGSDVIDEEGGKALTGGYNVVRGAAVIQYASVVLDQAIALTNGSHRDVAKYSIKNGELVITLTDGSLSSLLNPDKFVGYKGPQEGPSTVLVTNNGLHIEIQIDREHEIGTDSPSGVKDVIMEAAITTIQDFEDSVAAVDAEDKAVIYENFLGLLKGDLEDTFDKDGKTVTRRLSRDREYITPDGGKVTLPGRSLLLVRNVGHLMTNPAILDKDGNEVPEGIMDAFFTGLIGLHDLKGEGPIKNSREGSIYVVKPKMHGPEEVAFACEIFASVEQALGIKSTTIKIGIMDEERRTTVNLKECVRAASDRVVFINTGFLDRTGDEMHTSMEAGAFLPKADIKTQPWIDAYEDWNVDIGLETGFKGKAQIGKGMWAMPDEMNAMMKSKIAHPQSGANTAWVPSPTGATLHAIHYHQCSVVSRQNEIANRTRANLDDILTIPLLGGRNLSDQEVQDELDNNVQGILGYVVRWVDQGIGCSKVPNINNIGLMEDRATLRISSQHIVNWLHHNICTEGQVLETLKRMASIVDDQNLGDQNYKNMCPNFDGVAFSAACNLIFKGRQQPSGYTEPILHAKRQEAKNVV
ncbi:malate synthase G [Gammaproteobacteria bacterium]|nr:malate synthase G [Gammaproteobacteria bacterium]